MAEVEVGGVKVKGGKSLAVLMGLGSLIGALYGGFEVYKDYMDMKDKLANLDVGAIEQRIDVAMVKLDEAIDYAKDIKNDLRSDVIAVEKALGDVEARIRLVEGENRESIQDAKKWFEDRSDKTEAQLNNAKEFFENKSSSVDDKIADMTKLMNDIEERLNTKLQRALDNPLLKDLDK